MITILKPDFEFQDDRGSLVQLVHDGWKQVNAVSTKKGEIRGNHYHQLNREAYYFISGKAKVVLEYKGETQEYIFQTGDMFVVEPYVVHTFEYLEDSSLVILYDLGVEKEDGTMDTFIPSSDDGE